MADSEVKVDVTGDVEKDTSQEKVDVTAESKLAAEDQLVAKIKADFETLYGSRIKQVESQFENFRHGAYRIQDELKKQVDQLKSQVTKSTPPESSSRKDPWAEIENGSQWKSEIEKLAEQKAEEKLQSWHLQQETRRFADSQRQTFLDARALVEEKYPDLHHETGNPETAVSKAFLSVMERHPDWWMREVNGITWTNPYGPVMTMAEMERQLIADSKSSVPAGMPVKSRVAIAGLPQSRSAASNGERLTLTREQKAFCDYHKIKYEDYINTAAVVEQGAVEV